MDSFEWNKVFGAVLATALIVMFINNFTDTIFHKEEGALAYTIEVAEADAGAAAEVEQGPTLAELLADADASKGARLFAGCKGCHTIDGGSKKTAGPDLYGIVGRKIAGVEGYGYTPALGAVEGNWTWENLDAWLTNPKSFADGTAMTFKMGKADKRAQLMAWLRTQSDAPVDLPTVAAEVVEEAAEAVEEATGDAVDAAADAVEGAAAEVVDGAAGE